MRTRWPLNEAQVDPDLEAIGVSFPHRRLVPELKLCAVDPCPRSRTSRGAPFVSMLSARFDGLFDHVDAPVRAGSPAPARSLFRQPQLTSRTASSFNIRACRARPERPHGSACRHVAARPGSDVMPRPTRSFTRSRLEVPGRLACSPVSVRHSSIYTQALSPRLANRSRHQGRA